MLTVADVFEFLRTLREHNDREWFNENKPRYLELKSFFEEIVGRLIERIAIWDEDVQGLRAKDCIFRIYRDMRFSQDKIPYKTHFGAYISGFGGRNSGRCGYYLHLEPGGSLLAGGCYNPSPTLLKKIRQDIYENVEEFVSIVQNPDFVKEFHGIEETGKLKRVPRPYPEDFVEGDLLKYKHYDIYTYREDRWFENDDWLDQAEKVFKKMYPLNRFLNYTIDNASNIS